MWTRRGTDRPTRSRREPRESSGRPAGAKILLISLCLTALAAAVATCAWLLTLPNRPVGRGDFERTVVIARGASYNRIIEQLRAAGLLPHPFVFDYLAWRRGDAARLRPGRYRLRSSMSVRQIYETLLRGAPIKLTVPEGWTVRQIAERLAAEGLVADADAFIKAAHDRDLLVRCGVRAASAEGYILPETYHFDPGEPVERILGSMVRAFVARYRREASSSAPLSLSWHQVVTLASLVEREARNDDEKPLIASVYYNRLRRGMKLNCDATVRYALSKWREPLTKEDLKTSSPYNTYLNVGLPPGPICSVGRKSLEAALRPARTDFLYYCYKGDGSHYFSRTLAEHRRAVRKFLRKRLTGRCQGI